jgi:hypothetical protein
MMKNQRINRVLLITAILCLTYLPACYCVPEDIGIIETLEEYTDGHCADMEPDDCCKMICVNRRLGTWEDSYCIDFNSQSACDEDDMCTCCKPPTMEGP